VRNPRSENFGFTLSARALALGHAGRKTRRGSLADYNSLAEPSRSLRVRFTPLQDSARINAGIKRARAAREREIQTDDCPRYIGNVIIRPALRETLPISQSAKAKNEGRKFPPQPRATDSARRLELRPCTNRALNFRHSSKEEPRLPRGITRIIAGKQRRCADESARSLLFLDAFDGGRCAVHES